MQKKKLAELVQTGAEQTESHVQEFLPEPGHCVLLTNEFLAVNQYAVLENHNNKRPDIVLLVNGLPLVVIELKNATDETADVQVAFNQLQTYKQLIPCLDY